MGFGIRMRRLSHLKAGVTVSLVLALFAAVWSVQKVSVSPPGLSPRSLEMATASTHVIVDTPTSALLDLRQDTYSLEALTNRAILLGNVMASGPVRREIAKRAGIPIERLQISAPLTRQQPQARVESGNEKHMSDILASTDQYHLSIQANPTVPMLDLYAQTPKAESAERLANAAVDELSTYLRGLADSEQTPQKDQIQLMQLGRATGAVINGGVHWQVALLAFFLTFAASCATAIFVSRVRQGWRQAAQDEWAATQMEEAAASPR
jgi:hypothetical protein